MAYILKNTKTGKYILSPNNFVDDTKAASHYKTLKNAKNAHQAGKLGPDFIIIDSSDNGNTWSVSTLCPISRSGNTVKGVKKAPIESVNVPVKKHALSLEETINIAKNVEKINELLFEFNKSLGELIAPQEVIEDAIDVSSDEILDIYHTIELSTFNACEGYKLCKRLQNALRNRRSLKDAEDMNEALQAILSDTQEIVDKQKDRTYCYRVTTDLKIRKPKNKK